MPAQNLSDFQLSFQKVGDRTADVPKIAFKLFETKLGSAIDAFKH